jgi:hypothetical protein
MIMHGTFDDSRDLDFNDQFNFHYSHCIDNIKMGLLEIGLGHVDWIGLAQDRYRWTALVKEVMNLWVP